jgi:hypothetical protein
MFDRPTRRGLLGTLLAGLLALLRPGGGAAAPALCPHPAHQPLCAARPGRGWWYRVHLRLACPRCGATVHQRGYLPAPAYAACDLVLPPDYRPPSSPVVAYSSYDRPGSPGGGATGGCWRGGRTVSYTYDASGRLLSVTDPRPG